jgi:N-acetylmuramoyl-L-alanine amidase
LKLDTSKYEKELHKNKVASLFEEALKTSEKKIKPKKTESKKDTTVKKVEKKKQVKIKIKPKKQSLQIKTVFAQDNQIILNFQRDITKKDIKFFELHYTNLHKDVYDIVGNFKDARPTKLKIAGVNRIYITQYKKNLLRIIFAHKRNLKTKYEIVENQLIITVKDPDKVVNKKNNIYAFRHSKVVVIDAGHGGKDPGAVGYKRFKEKDVVLSVSNKLKSILKKRGYKVYTTRSRDRFITLRSRTKLANKKDADIFISIHTNAAPKKRIKSAKGIETFFLSPARSERAKRVAALENRSDMRKMDNSSKNDFLFMTNQTKITASHKLSIDVHRNLLYNLEKKYKGVVDHGVREGPFWVLVGALMPSILIELGYITHPQESLRLVNKRYQDNLALGIANGIDEYFVNNP